MRIAIGSDPNAESAKIELIKHIEKGGYGEVVDFEVQILFMRILPYRLQKVLQKESMIKEF